MPEGGAATTIMSLGFDPVKDRYVGTFIASMMTHLWVYEGALDPAGKVLTLHTEGPGMETGVGMARYRDVMELKSADHRVLSSHIQQVDGEWKVFMTANYQRKT